MKCRPSTTGFTLIELMLTVLIASILTAIAIPSYRNYSIQARIPEATSQLTFYRFRMEQYYQDNQTYRRNAICGIALTNTKNFNYSCVTLNDGQSYLITAQGNNVNNMGAFAYTINEAGRTATTALPAAWGTVPRNCWILKANRGCVQ